MARCSQRSAAACWDVEQTHVEVNPLGPADVEHLARLLVGDAAGPESEFARRIAAESQGSP